MAQPLTPTPENVHHLTSFPVAAVILLHYFTCGIFSLVWLNLMHGKLPRVRSDDPSAGKAVGFCFIPFFNLYWIFFTYRRLCLRIDEQRALYGLPPSNLRGMATTACIFQLIPYINALIGYTIITPIFIGLMQSSVNQLVKQTSATRTEGHSGNTDARARNAGMGHCAGGLYLFSAIWTPRRHCDSELRESADNGAGRAMPASTIYGRLTVQNYNGRWRIRSPILPYLHQTISRPTSRTVSSPPAPPAALRDQLGEDTDPTCSIARHRLQSP